ncbi:MAG: Tim44 domain-containing protein [Bacilli bacterium]|nr:Tim44 domain-containing protein [Bacilli bacterium]
MKRIIIFAVFLVLSVFIYRDFLFLSSKEFKSNNYNIVDLRAGGGGSSSGSAGGGSSSGHSSGSTGSGNHGSYNLISRIMSNIIFLFILFSSAIMLYIKVIRSSINSKRYLRILKKTDCAWNYKKIERQVIDAFYVIQQAWTSMDMSNARDYMDVDLYDSFSIKLEWMRYNNKQNILKRIRLVNLKPFFVHDDDDNLKDSIWFYIKGRMIDYTINTETNEKIDGNSYYSTSFIEFWKFVRTEDDRWILAKIVQKDEIATIGR